MIGVLLVTIVVIPNTTVRGLCAAFLSGPLAWSALQLARRGRGVLVEGERCTVQICAPRRNLNFAVSDIQGWSINNRDQLQIAFMQSRKTVAGDEPRPSQLRYVISAALDDPAALSAALPASCPFSPEQMRTLAGMRRVRRALLWGAGLFVGIPLAVVITWRVAAAVWSVIKIS